MPDAPAPPVPLAPAEAPSDGPARLPAVHRVLSRLAGLGLPRRELALSVAGGLLLALSFPPVAWRPLAFLGPALLVLAVRDRRPLSGATAGFCFGLAAFLPQLHWVTFAGPDAWIVLCLIEAAFLAALGAALTLVLPLKGWPVWAAALWVVDEALRGRIPFGGFTWGRLGYSQDAGPVLRWAMAGGAPLMTFVVAAVASLVALAVVQLDGERELFGRPAFRRAGVTLCVALFLAGSGWLLTPVRIGPRTAVVAVVQGNVPRLGLDAFAQAREVTAYHVDATFELATKVEAGIVEEPDLVIWPENSSDADPRNDPEAARLLNEASQRIGQQILVGAVLDAPNGGAYNSGLVWDPETGPVQVYVKQHLVPYGEYVPLRSLLEPMVGRLAQIPRDFVAGKRPGTLQLNGYTIADVICFEVAYDGLVRDTVRGGGELLVVQTNNATFGRSAETRQQLAVSRIRAVEHGRTVVVAATSGISAVIDPRGRTLDQSRIFTRDLLVERVPLRTGRTLATRAGALPEVLLCLIGAVGLGLGVRRRRLLSREDAF